MRPPHLAIHILCDVHEQMSQNDIDTHVGESDPHRSGISAQNQCTYVQVKVYKDHSRPTTKKVIDW